MRFSIHMAEQVRGQIENLAKEMKSWEEHVVVDEDQKKRIREGVRFFGHTTRHDKLTIGGVDGSGDFPSLSYGDSFVYVTLAQGAVYEANTTHGLKEISLDPEPLTNFACLPENQAQCKTAMDQAFERLAGDTIQNIISQSDYLDMKSRLSKTAYTPDVLSEHLIRPHASDSSNIAIQLRSTGESGAALRLIRSETKLDYVLLDTTLSLPFVIRKNSSLFYEHVKRLCCKEARTRNISLLALSKSHGMAGMELIEELAAEAASLGKGKVAEHWYLRVPSKHLDRWEMTSAQDRSLPPHGAVTYLIRFHRNTPVLRIDMDVEHWNNRVYDKDQDTMARHEAKIFEDLDYTCHDQRCYGYPYPLKAGHNRASMTNEERLVLRKQIIEAAVRAGMKRSLFRDASVETGHA